jgi:solute carrier family 34 (sodium-dependent phosphate cotransporter)
VRVSNVVQKVGALLIQFLTFLLLVQFLGQAITQIDDEWLLLLITVGASPFVCFFIGLITTAVVQSSLVVSVITLILISAEVFTIQSGIFIHLGIPLGASLQSSLQALNLVTKKSTFKKALTTASSQDFFFILTILCIFPLEYYYQIVSNTAFLLNPFGLYSFKSFGLFPFVKFKVDYPLFAKISVLSSTALLLVSQKYWISWAAHRNLIMVWRHTSKLNDANWFTLFIWGMKSSLLLGSQHLVSNLVVRAVVRQSMTCKNGYFILIGSTLGSCFLLPILALMLSGSALIVAIGFCLIHIFGAFIIMTVPLLRTLPLELSKKLSKWTLKNRLIGILYISAIFFIIPFWLIYFNKDSVRTKTYIQISENSNFLEMIEANAVETSKRRTSKAFKTHWLFYRKFNQGNFNSNSILQAQIQTILQEDYISFNQQKFFLKQKNFCWNNEDLWGKYQICLQAVLNKYPTEAGFTVNKCYIFFKEYTLPLHPNIKFVKYYIAPEEKLMLRYETYDENMNLLYKEELYRQMPQRNIQ